MVIIKHCHSVGGISKNLKLSFNNERLNVDNCKSSRVLWKVKVLPRSGTCLEKNGIQNMVGDKLADETKMLQDFSEHAFNS